MGYYMRFFATESKQLTLELLESALRQLDGKYAITERDSAGYESGLLTYAGELFGQISINAPGDGMFDEEIEEFREEVSSTSHPRMPYVLSVLKQTTTIFAVQVLFFDRETEDTLIRIDPIWEWLSANYTGLHQADGEGFYEGTELIFPIGRTPAAGE